MTQPPLPPQLPAPVPGPPVAPPAPVVPPVVPPVVTPPVVPPVVPPAPPVDNGFPANTPLEQMTLEQQVAYWKHYSRQHEATAKARADYDAIKAKADELDQYKAANATEHEKAVKAAADAARAQALAEATPRLVSAEFRAAVGTRLTKEQLDTALGPLDLRWFLDATGNVDVAKVAAHAALIAPVTPGTLPPGTFPAMGQGTYPGGAKPSVAAGKDMYAAQKPKTP